LSHIRAPNVRLLCAGTPGVRVRPAIAFLSRSGDQEFSWFSADLLTSCLKPRTDKTPVLLISCQDP
jgi:hypothetical protein